LSLDLNVLFRAVMVKMSNCPRRPHAEAPEMNGIAALGEARLRSGAAAWSRTLTTESLSDQLVLAR
jgi:hypothetical protein